MIDLCSVVLLTAVLNKKKTPRRESVISNVAH
jgi:hypothetical protein